MDTQQQALLGILGGMGPLATVDFLGKLTSLTPASCDQDHVPWVTISQPGVPDRSAAIKGGNDGPGSFLVKGSAWLAAQGVKLIAIPCNTSHYWHDRMQVSAGDVPILHIADAAIEELQRSSAPAGLTAILATRGTVQAEIYSMRLSSKGFNLTSVSEDDQRVVDHVIRSVKGGEVDAGRKAMHQLIKSFAARRVKTVILGCTELPIAYEGIDADSAEVVQAVDTTLALATVSLRRLGYLK